MKTLSQVSEMIAHWEAQPESAQRDVCLAYWAKQAQKFIKYSRTVATNEGAELVANTGDEVKQAVKIVTKIAGVPMKKAGEDRHSQMIRLTSIKF